MAEERIGPKLGSIYQFKLLGELREEDVNLMSPCVVTLVRRGRTTTTFKASTDQAGIIGLMRFLHGMGFAFLEINLCKPELSEVLPESPGSE